MISAGEASGDMHAANLVRALHEIDPNIQVKGMGSEQLRQTRTEIIVDCADIAVMGIWEVIKKYCTIKKALNLLVAELKRSPPDLLILVDYQEFNFRLAQTAKSMGIRVLFYIGPQVWAWRSKRVHTIGKKIDHMAVLFPFEEDFYREANIPVTFVGHPLVDEAKASHSVEQCLQKYGLDGTQPIVGLFPGSRRSEVQKILPCLLESAAKILQKRPNLQFILPQASTISEQDLQPHLAQYPDLPITVLRDSPYNVMQVCSAIAVASGTATLEIALMGIPNLIVYKLAPLSYWILKRMITIDNIGLVNIVAEKMIVREFIQHEASADNIVNELEKLLDSGDYRQNMIAALGQVKAKLGKPGGSKHIAELAFKMLNQATK